MDKEELGDSSPVDKEGTIMMARSFYETQKASLYAKKIEFYEKILNRKNV